MPRTILERSDVVPLLAEIFRDLGYEGTTVSRITERTGLGKGSLYHHFPGGKEEMAAAVLAEIDAWFEAAVFVPLRRGEPIAAMWDAVDRYFRSGGRVCLVGAFALEETRDRFAVAIQAYFRRWIGALREALVRAGHAPAAAGGEAESIVLGIQGALVLARALDDKAVFSRTIDRFKRQLAL